MLGRINKDGLRRPPASAELLATGALLLDLDGTLLDFADRPDAVTVPAELIANLGRLQQALDGALGIVTGRKLTEADALLAPLSLAAAGEHGRALRRRAGGPAEFLPAPHLPEEWLARAAGFAAAHPGVLLERKSAGLVLHFRAVPGLVAAVHAFLDGLVGEATGFELMPAAMAWEVRPRGVHKGAALRALMAEPPFRGRLPVFVGDDVTDEDAIAAAEALGGTGLRVADSFGAPAGVRAWIASLAGQGHAPAA